MTDNRQVRCETTAGPRATSTGREDSAPHPVRPPVTLHATPSPRPSTPDTRHSSPSSLDRFGGYQKALELFDLVVSDMAVLQKDPRCYRLIAQQVASADSVCSNIEEGYGRLSRAEYVRFLDFARGSARETQGRYRRMKHWLDDGVVRQRTELLDAIIGILTNSIQRLRSAMSAIPRPSTPDTRPSTPDTRHPTP